MNFYDYNIPGQRDSMFSISYTDLYQSDTVRFDYAYAQYNAGNIDSLSVRISTDGGVSFPFEIFRRGGLGLATAPQTSSYFVPQNNTQWRSFSFPLSSIVSATSSATEIPSEFQLHQNFPNPFNPSTTISFALPVKTFAKLVIHDIAGKEIALLTQGYFDAGKHQVTFDATDLSSGVYFFSLKTPGYSTTRRMVLLK